MNARVLTATRPAAAPAGPARGPAVLRITRAIARTEATPRLIGLPGGGDILTTMKDVHGASMVDHHRGLSRRPVRGTALSFTPRSWPAFIAGNLLVGLTYACIGALAGAALGQLGATYVVLFLAMRGPQRAARSQERPVMAWSPAPSAARRR